MRPPKKQGTLRQVGIETRRISPAWISCSDSGFALLSQRKRNHARSALLRVSLLTSLRSGLFIYEKEGETQEIILGWWDSKHAEFTHEYSNMSFLRKQESRLKKKIIQV